MFDAPIVIASPLGSDDIGKGDHVDALGPAGAGSNFDSAVDEYPRPILEYNAGQLSKCIAKVM